MNSQENIHYAPSTGAHNTERFCEFLDELYLIFEQRNITEAVLVMDNVRFHKVKEVGQRLENKGHRVVYLPPYSPFLNLIENMFSKWKEYVRRARPQNQPNPLELIESGANMGTGCGAFFRNMMDYVTRCLRRETIINK
ncbi:hypothetical protein TELCIR_00126 [Teladorsagia circumcincta]|uniref:Tc1-like transposase DDE domain-containing protein n=1 Tax=Teladorsagia circumcincta TaxID=45464 RepID=A0A2G9V5D8_TELCI|nr:hypothetical protein TELCIR_00126 [Teladorsagia circumcincta]